MGKPPPHPRYRPTLHSADGQRNQRINRRIAQRSSRGTNPILTRGVDEEVGRRISGFPSKSTSIDRPTNIPTKATNPAPIARGLREDCKTKPRRADVPYFPKQADRVRGPPRHRGAKKWGRETAARAGGADFLGGNVGKRVALRRGVKTANTRNRRVAHQRMEGAGPLAGRREARLRFPK